MNLSDVSAFDIEQMSYNEVISVVRETNRPPGGAASVRRIAIEALLRPQQRVLEIGTSTGYTAIELALLTGSSVVGVDINRRSLEEAARRASERGVENLCRFECHNAEQLPYGESSFDMVFCGNVTSLVGDRRKAFSEYRRVLKAGGHLAAIPMYYITPPPTALINEIRQAIQVAIEPQYKHEWELFYSCPELQVVYSADFVFESISEKVIDDFADTILSRAHLNRVPCEARSVLDRKYRAFLKLFGRNLSLMGFTILLLRKLPPGLDPELFSVRPV